MGSHQVLQIAALMEVYHFGTASTTTPNQERALGWLKSKKLVCPYGAKWALTNEGLRYANRLFDVDSED